VGLSPAPSRCAVKPLVERAAAPERKTRLSIVSSGTRPRRPGILALLLRAPAFYFDMFVGALIVLAVVMNTAVRRVRG